MGSTARRTTPGPDGIGAYPAPAPIPIGATRLATFDGINPNGEWQLFVADDAGGDTGQLVEGWSITIKAKVRTRNQ